VQLGIPQLVTLMRRRVVAQLVRAERDGSLYLYAGCASLAGAVGLTLLPTRKNEEVLAPKELALTDAERRAAAKRAESEHAGLVQWALSTAGESESMHSNATTQAQPVFARGSGSAIGVVVVVVVVPRDESLTSLSMMASRFGRVGLGRGVAAWAEVDGNNYA